MSVLTLNRSIVCSGVPGEARCAADPAPATPTTGTTSVTVGNRTALCPLHFASPRGTCMPVRLQPQQTQLVEVTLAVPGLPAPALPFFLLPSPGAAAVTPITASSQCYTQLPAKVFSLV